MSSPAPDRLPADIERLLEVERHAPPPPPAAVARVHLRVARTLGLPGGLGAPFLGSGGGYLVGAVLLAAAAVGGWRAIHPSRHPSPPVTAVASVAPAAAPPAPPSSPLPSPPPPPSPPSPAALRPTTPAARPAQDGLARESALLREAHRRLQDGRPRAALALLTRHQRRWPHGVLEQEREVLAVEALAASGDDRAARARATLFLRSHPGSTLGAAALRPIDRPPR